MKITIDTKEDSHDDIKKVISILNQLVDGKTEVVANKNIFEDDNSFGQTSEPTTTETSAPEPTQQSSGGIFSMFNDTTTSSSTITSTTPTEESTTTKTVQTIVEENEDDIDETSSVKVIRY